jgi:hypothetical protein
MPYLGPVNKQSIGDFAACPAGVDGWCRPTSVKEEGASRD